VKLSRREFFLGVGGTAVGVAGITGVEEVSAHMHKHLMYHERYAAAVRATRTSPAPSQPRSTVVWSANTDQKRIALTFDDGPNPDWTSRVLDVLAKHDARATFFMCGHCVRDHGGVHADSVGVHEFGNHTWDHPEVSLLDYDSCLDQLQRTQDMIVERLGCQPTLFRPPFGYLGGSALMAASELGLTTVLWNARMYDEVYEDNPPAIVDWAADTIQPGQIWLAHDNGSNLRLVSLSYLDEIISRWRDLGYEVTTVSELIGQAVST
jgi:peptidoglycan/xylan/chitin deacetylase (PgdA/CDA1 family)